MSVLSPLQIKEANAHLAAVHRQVAELEKRLRTTEETVREQAESLIRKDEQFRTALQEIAESKEREISDLREKFMRSEDTVQKLLGVIKEKDDVISQLKHRSQLLSKICQSRPLLDSLLIHMTEGERLGVFPGVETGSVSPVIFGVPQSNGGVNSNNFTLCEDDGEDQELEKTLFGTTV
ncbi:vimentin-type intermediate filament-associated coiled-coil protein-like [Ambystoma mexicanum]|uniref:vimentin-type intermediate filament-associated coiled-coil protein-like n=1 Tax=Ambystoma mexicanum TaxID=8296 RepID=UPI0037E86954